MGMRITTNMMMNTYRYNLSGSTNKLSNSRDKVLTQRKFNSYAEDPATATHAWRVRRSLTRNAGYQVSNTEAYSRLNSAWATMASVDDKLLNGDGGAFTAIKRADNDPTAGARTALGDVLDNLAESVVFSLNGAQYGDHFLFAGNDEMNAPFTWDGDKLLYRGVNVDAGGVADPTKAPDWGELDEYGVPVNMPENPANAYEAAWKKYYEARGAVNTQEAVKPAQDAWFAAQGPLAAAEADYNKARDAYNAAVVAFRKDYPNDIDADGNILNPRPTDPADPNYSKLTTDLLDAKAAMEAAAAVYNEAKTNLETAETNLHKVEADWGEAQKVLDSVGITNYPGNPGDPADKPHVTMDDIAFLDPSKAALPDWYPSADDIEKKGTSAFLGLDLPTGDQVTSDIEKAFLERAYDQRDLAMLDAMSAEVKNMDLGMGLQEETGNRDLLQSTAFNRALPGINMIGYGVDEDGDPKNIVSIMKRLAELYGQATEEGKYPKYDENGEIMYDADGNVIEDQAKVDEVYRLLDKFGQAHNEFNKAYSEVDTRSEFLLANGERLKNQGYTLKEQIADLEQVELADAIQDFSWSYYCYSAALKIGNQLLSQSLIDYMG